MKLRIINQDNISIDFKQDYININKTVAISAHGIIFKIGDIVCHEGSEIEGETAKIESFSINEETQDIIAHTTKGTARICFIFFSEEQASIEWFNSLSFEERFYKTIEANSVLVGDTVDNNPNLLTDLQILKIYKYHKSQII